MTQRDNLSATFGQRLNELYDRMSTRRGSRIPLSQLSQEIEEKTSVRLSKAYLSGLLTGTAPSPRLEATQALADYFQVDPAQFFRAPEPEASSGEADGTRGPLEDTAVERIRMRAVGLSEESLNQVAAILDRIRSLEGLPEASADD